MKNEKNNFPQEIIKKIKSSKKILLALHNGVDGDSLGSCSAMKYLLENKFKKRVKLISQEKLTSPLNSFNYTKEIEIKKFKDINKKDFDCFIALDFGTSEHLENLNQIYTINIDHHETNDYYGNLNYILKDKCSTCSVLIDLFKEIKMDFDSELSTRLLLGVYTDSGHLTHGGVEALKDATYLVERGANYLEGIVNKIKFNIPLKIKQYLALAVNNFQIKKINNLRVGYSIIPLKEIKNLNLNLSNARGAPNYLQEIEGIDLLFTLTEMPDFLKGSFRTRKDINVSEYAKQLGGGGHKKAAAFKLEKMPLDKAKSKVFEAIKKIKKNS